MTNDQEQHWRSYTTAINTISTRKAYASDSGSAQVVTKSNMLTAPEATV